MACWCETGTIEGITVFTRGTGEESVRVPVPVNHCPSCGRDLRVTAELTNTDPVRCPRCLQSIPVDSLRYHNGGLMRVYWECQRCDVSVMRRVKALPQSE